LLKRRGAGFHDANSVGCGASVRDFRDLAVALSLPH